MKKIMKPIYIGLTILVLITLLSSGVYANNTLLISGDRYFPPYEFYDDDGEYRGFNVDLMRALSLEMGVDIRFVPMDWVDAHVALQNGEIDIIQGMNFNDNRRAVYDFSDQYLNNSIVCFVDKDNQFIIDLKDLRNRRVAVQRSDFAAYLLAEIGEIEVVFFTEMEEAFEQLLNERVDAVVGNRLTGLYAIQKARIEDSIKIVGEELQLTSYGIAVKKGNTELLNQLNTALDSIQRSGVYDKIYEKWFGAEIRPVWKGLMMALYMLGAILFLSLILVFASWRWNRKLKELVDKRTQLLNESNQELERKQHLISESDQFKEQILNGMRNGLITLDKNGLITAINRSCENLLNLSSDRHLNLKYSDAGLENYFDFNHIEESLEKGAQFSFVEKKIMTGEDEKIISYSLEPLLDFLGSQQGIILSITDITEVTTLRRKLAEKDKMQYLGRLVTGIAHEIRNPLTSIKTYIDLLPKKYDQDGFRKKITTQVPQEINRLNTLLTSLLDYAKSKNALKESFSLGKTVAQIVELYETELQEKEIQLQFNNNDKVEIFADKQQIKQIVINLLLNSIQAVDKYGKISIGVLKEEGKAVLFIKDDGVGISQTDQRMIFEPFYTTKESGTGLGLAISYEYIKANNGTISIESSEDVGTLIEVRFELPQKVEVSINE